jgi:hypothetical protein
MATPRRPREKPGELRDAAIDPTVLHQNSVIKEVKLAHLKVDRSYQRQPSHNMVDSIAAEWDVVASELILVADRGPRAEGSGVEGGLHVINGQHRTLAARRLQHETIWARVIDLKKEADPGAVEAELRLKTNVRLGDRPLERFKAQVRSGDEDSIALVTLLARFDTEVNEIPVPETGINAISTFEGLWAWDQGALLNDTLEIVRDAHGQVGGKNAVSGYVKGLAWFVEKHSGDVDRDRLTDRLRIMGHEALERRARASQSTNAGPLWINYYRMVVDLYNEKLHERSRLTWQTRGATGFAPRPRYGQTTAAGQSWGRGNVGGT